MKSSKAANRYAKSLMSLAGEKGQLDEVQRDMELIRDTVRENRELELLLKSPIIKADKKGKVLEDVFRGKISDTAMGFIGIMVRKGRENLLTNASVELVRLAKASKHIFEAKVTTAAPLDGPTREKVMAIIERLRPEKGTTELEEEINPDILGGFIIRLGDRMVDASVASRIRDLKRDFSENPYVPEF